LPAGRLLLIVKVREGGLRGPQGRLRDGRDACKDTHGLGHQDRDEGDGLHLRSVRQPVGGQAAAAHQGPVGMKTSQHSSSAWKDFGGTLLLRWGWLGAGGRHHPPYAGALRDMTVNKAEGR
jgi:hypothetical protein